MRNRTLLLLMMVLGISTTAWAACTVDVSVSPPNPTPGNDVQVQIDLTVPNNYSPHPAVDVTQMWNTYYVDVVYDCKGCAFGCRSDVLKPDGPGSYPNLRLHKPPCGMDFVVVRVWVNCQICGIPATMLCGMDMTWFWVQNPCCLW
jgi:hypothetical protein